MIIHTSLGQEGPLKVEKHLHFSMKNAYRYSVYASKTWEIGNVQVALLSFPTGVSLLVVALVVPKNPPYVAQASRMLDQ